MLEPTDRFMLVDALRPPAGYTLDLAVGTTYTLNLDTLLLAAVSFAVFDHLDDETGHPNPIAILESVRRHADKMTIFAQAGAMSGPRNHPPILAYLEEAVVPVRPPRPGHLFHPKLWALRFASDTGDLRYRLVIMSRNLTFDSSWDTIVQLDGSPSDTTSDTSSPVGGFIAQLPALAVTDLDPGRSAEIDRFADQLSRVEWELPPDVRGMRFHPLGTGFESPTITGDRVLVVSPFLTHDIAQTLGQAPGPNLLVSRPTAIDQLGGDALRGFQEVLVFNVSGEIEPQPFDDDGSDPVDIQESDVLEVEPPRPGVELSGLHAKIFVTEAADTTRLWLGSANATGPAFGGNAEFMVEFDLDPNRFTIDSIIDDGGSSSLRQMLMPYEPASDAPTEPTAVETATRRLDLVLRDLASVAYQVTVSANGDDFQLDLDWEAPTNAFDNIRDHGLDVVIGPATLTGARVPYGDGHAIITSATLEAITSFLVIEARTRVDGEQISGRTLVNARLVGAPIDRNDQVLAGMLDDPDKVLRYLLLLLADLTDDPALVEALGVTGAAFDWGSSEATPPLLESLLRALARSPESLDHVASFVEALRAGRGANHLPDGFDDVWTPIDAARKALR